jgi:hypothetical protein
MWTLIIVIALIIVAIILLPRLFPNMMKGMFEGFTGIFGSVWKNTGGKLFGGLKDGGSKLIDGGKDFFDGIPKIFGQTRIQGTDTEENKKEWKECLLL